MKIVEHADDEVEEVKSGAFSTTFEQLKEILEGYESQLLIRHDTEKIYSVYTQRVEQRGNQFLFGRVEIHDFCVTYELEALDIYPELFTTISPDLRKCMHGTSSFIFTFLEPEDVAKLERLTQRCYERLRGAGFIEKKVA